jgi:hypothetical protein
MAATVAQKGVGVVWGVNGITCTGLLTTSTGKVQSNDMERTANRREILDGNGELVGQIFFDKRRKGTIVVIPSSTTISGAGTNMDALQPAPGTLITFADADGTVYDGSYSLISAKLARAKDQEATITMEIEMSEANDATAAIT